MNIAANDLSPALIAVIALMTLVDLGLKAGQRLPHLAQQHAKRSGAADGQAGQQRA